MLQSATTLSVVTLTQNYQNSPPQGEIPELNSPARKSTLAVSVRIAKKIPCNYLPFWHNISQFTKKGMGYCSNINTFNLYLQKLFWKTRKLELPNFSR